MWDTFTKPGADPDKQFEQVAFVKSFGHYDWYFGSAEYLDTATKKTDRHVLDSIAQIDRHGKNYVFVVDMDGNVILHPDTGEYGTKITYVHRLPHSDWIVGSGFFMEDLYKEIDKQKVAMYESYTKEYTSLLVQVLLITLLSLLISFFISRMLKRSFKKYRIDIADKTRKLEVLNETLEDKVRQRTGELEKLATTDALTKIHNRYSVMQILEQEVRRAKRYKLPLSVMMYDIDHFKKINDRYGHDVGDSVLTELTRLVERVLRDVDTLGRYGGEEFLIIMPSTYKEDAKTLADRLLELVRGHEFKYVGELTISLGLAQLETKESKTQFFKRLDQLLYRSKKSGRDRLSY